MSPFAERLGEDVASRDGPDEAGAQQKRRASLLGLPLDKTVLETDLVSRGRDQGTM
jgi:hypothetical protein